MTPLPRSHTAVVLTAPGQPLAEQVRPTSVPEGDDVLVRVSHVGIGHLDVWRADHGLLLEQYPHVLGANIAGTVAAVGLDASDRFKEGERVFVSALLRSRSRRLNLELKVFGSVALSSPSQGLWSRSLPAICHLSSLEASQGAWPGAMISTPSPSLKLPGPTRLEAEPRFGISPPLGPREPIVSRCSNRARQPCDGSLVIE